MVEYINRELLLNDLETSIVVSGRPEIVPSEFRGINKVVDRIKAMPTEDVVPVVRCKDCIYNKGKSVEFDNIIFCHKDLPKARTLNDYCSYGERKDDE